MKTERAVSNAELYEFLKSTCRDGLPYMNTDLFTKTTEKWTREVFRSTLADFITREKPNFPYKTLTHTDLQKHFYRLKKVDYSTYIHPGEQQKKE